jgi:hypothetical protein
MTNALQADRIYIHLGGDITEIDNCFAFLTPFIEPLQRMVQKDQPLSLKTDGSKGLLHRTRHRLYIPEIAVR